MAVKWETVKVGDRLYDYHSERAGNTTLRRWSNWEVVIKEIDHAKGTALVVWNGNTARTWYRRQVERLRRKPGKEKDPFAGLR